MSIEVTHATPKIQYYNNKQQVVFNYPCTSHSVCTPYEVKLKRGSYYLEVYGAQGSNATLNNKNYQGGKGGYSAGIYTTKQPITLYLFVGASTNSTVSIEASFGGGGKGSTNNDGPGGGATDFRFAKGDITNTLYSRIIVAGGGGGAYYNGDKWAIGGAGGGTNGGQGQKVYATPCYATQNGVTDGQSVNGYTYKQGTFGYGSGDYYGGGGGGYFGGCNTASGGSGGSGFIGGVSGTNIYKRTTVSGQNPGLGWAKITIINYAFSCKAHRQYLRNTPFIFILQIRS